MGWTRGLAATVWLALTAGAASADVALVIAAAETERRGLLGSTDLDTRPDFRAAGFDVISADASAADSMRAALSELLARIDDETRVVIHLSGRFMQGGGRSWLVEESAAAPLDLATVDGAGLSLDTVLAIAARKPGAAVVALGRGSGDGAEPRAGLSTGIDLGAIPQGVTVFEGAAADIAGFVRNRLTAPGLSFAEMAGGSVRASGFLGPVDFLPENEVRPIAPPDPAEAERAIWQAAEALDTVEAYRGYLDRYPQGLFAAEAIAAIEEIEAEPLREARLTEEALGLSRDTRRRIQRELTLLDYEPRGIDGIFGSGTRSAIRRFQVRSGFPETGYLDRLQIERLGLQAARRQAEIEAEQERQRLEAERQDRATWEATGAVGDEAGLRTYLRRYPDGLFSAEAKRQIAEIEAARKAEAEAKERAAWEEAESDGTIAAYQRYLRQYPDGSFAGSARERIAALQPPEDPLAEARAAEERLALPGVTLLLVEQRLAQLGMDPGPADGTLDAESRAAIRRFQQSRGIEATGYLSEAMLAQMLADLGGLILPGRN